MVHPHAAGIDVGNSAHYVAVRPDRERDPLTLAAPSDPRVHASQEEIAKSLEGNWRPELLFVLQQEVDMYDIYQKRITECNQRLQEHLASLTHSLPLQLPTQKAKTKKPAAKNAPRFDLSSELQRVAGVDLTRIDGIDVMVAQTRSAKWDST